MAGIDESRTFLPVAIAVLTVSDSRGPKEDESGKTLIDRLEAAGHTLAARAVVKDDVAQIRKQLTAWIDDPNIDVVITTALVPGRPAPKLVTAAAVRSMRPGSVVVDLAAESGGNCEVSVPGSVVVVDGVTIAAPLNLPATMPEHASELYARNVLALLELMLVDGKVAPDFSDEIIARSCLTRVPESESESEEKEA